ncbi:MAG: hypothetical protein M1457_07890 [bacterium]|nr:hypothetical protein [bacterium]
MPAARTPTMNAISTMNEKALHAGLKTWYGRAGDRFEDVVDGYLIDIVRGTTLIEIQTANFAAIKRKLARLLEAHPVRLVYPIAREKWIVKESAGGGRPTRRKSPRRGRIEYVFAELVRLPHLLAHDNFSLEVLLIREEEVRRHDPRRNWRRRGWGTHERRLIEVVERRVFDTPRQLAELLSPALPRPFTTLELAVAQGLPRRLAQAMAYCLREMGALEAVGKRGNAILYRPSGVAA